jgi:hypothetical protein
MVLSYQNYLAISNTANVTGNNLYLNAVYLRCECCWGLVAFYDIPGREGEALFYCSVLLFSLVAISVRSS